MAYTSLLVVALAFVAATGFSLQDSQSYDGLLSALSAVADRDAVEQRPGYMSALQRELEELAGSSPLSRVSRSARKRCAEHPICCGSGKRPEILAEIKAAHPECHLVTEEDEIEPGKHFNFTAMCESLQCIAKKMNVVDKDGYLLPAEFADAVANFYAEDSLKALVKELAPDCVTKANERVKGMKEADGNIKCNPTPWMASHCIEFGLISKCPEDLKVKNEECDEIRKRMDEWRNRDLSE